MKICIGCSENFVPAKSNQKYCSKKCWSRVYSKTYKYDQKAWRIADKKKDPQKYKEKQDAYYQKAKGVNGSKSSAARLLLKLEVLTHYGLNGTLQCCWEGCEVCDVDMLTLDHINNNGAADRKERKNTGGVVWYAQLKRNGFPIGLQTLCANHNLKKEVVKQRNKHVNRDGTETHKVGPQSAAVTIIV
jgi:hypothetical protein